MANTVDIFLCLRSVDRKVNDFFESLTEEEQKALQPYLLMRWMACTSSKQQIILINELLNPYVFSLYKHKSFLCKLSTVCTSGNVQQYTWIKRSSTKDNYPTTTKLLSWCYKCNIVKAVDIIKTLKAEDIIDMFESSGYQDDEINKARKELKLTTKKAKQPKQSKHLNHKESEDHIDTLDSFEF